VVLFQRAVAAADIHRLIDVTLAFGRRRRLLSLSPPTRRLAFGDRAFPVQQRMRALIATVYDVIKIATYFAVLI